MNNKRLKQLIKHKKHFMSAYNEETIGKRLNAKEILNIMPDLIINNGFKTVKNSVILTDILKTFVICKHYKTIIFIKDENNVKFLWNCSNISNIQIYYILQHLKLPYDRKYITSHSTDMHFSYTNEGWKSHKTFNKEVNKLKEEIKQYDE